jgi:hypothetical protein
MLAIHRLSEQEKSLWVSFFFFPPPIDGYTTVTSKEQWELVVAVAMNLYVPDL